MERIILSIKGFLNYSFLLKELVTRDIKTRYKKSFLGLFWTLLNPLLMMTVMTMIFSNLFRFEIPNFPVYYLTGSILFSFNSEATNFALQSIIGNASLIKKVYIPKYLFTFSKVISSLVNFSFAFIAMIVVMIFTKVEFYPTMFLSFIPLAYVFMFTTGLSLLLASTTVFFRDIIHLYGVFLLAWTYFTPLFYPVSIIPKNLMWVINMNPMYYYIEYFRQLVLYGTIPNLSYNLLCFAIGVGFLGIGLFVFYRKQDKFILYI